MGVSECCKLILPSATVTHPHPCGWIWQWFSEQLLPCLCPHADVCQVPFVCTAETEAPMLGCAILVG